MMNHINFFQVLQVGRYAVVDQDGRDGANLEATKQAWPATVEHLKKHLE